MNNLDTYFNSFTADKAAERVQYLEEKIAFCSSHPVYAGSARQRKLEKELNIRKALNS